MAVRAVSQHMHPPASTTTRGAKLRRTETLCGHPSESSCIASFRAIRIVGSSSIAPWRTAPL
eukprot:4479105-Pleurochrysis_carterae.AAC.2